MKNTDPQSRLVVGWTYQSHDSVKAGKPREYVVRTVLKHLGTIGKSVIVWTDTGEEEVVNGTLQLLDIPVAEARRPHTKELFDNARIIVLNPENYSAIPTIFEMQVSRGNNIEYISDVDRILFAYNANPELFKVMIAKEYPPTSSHDYVNVLTYYDSKEGVKITLYKNFGDSEKASLSDYVATEYFVVGSDKDPRSIGKIIDYKGDYEGILSLFKSGSNKKYRLSPKNRILIANRLKEEIEKDFAEKQLQGSQPQVEANKLIDEATTPKKKAESQFANNKIVSAEMAEAAVIESQMNFVSIPVVHKIAFISTTPLNK